MAAYKFEKGSFFVLQESSFGVDPDATGATYKHIKASVDAAYAPKQTVVERAGFIETMNRIPHVMGAQGGTVSFKTEVKGSGTAATSTATDAESHELLEAFLGTATQGVGTTVNDASATTTSFTVASAAGLSKYMMVLVDCGSTYGYVARFITDITGSVITLNRALPAAPANSAVVQASTMYTRASTGHKSVAIVARRDGILYTFLGCKLDSLNITTVEANGVAMFEWTFSVTTWNNDAKASLPATVLTGKTATPPPVVKGACYAVDATEELIYSLGISFGLEFAFQDSTCAQGVENDDSINAGFTLTKAAPTAAIKSWYAASHMTDYAAGTERMLSFACGKGAGNAWGFIAAKCQLTDAAQENRNGQVGESLAAAINDNGADPEYALCLA